MRQLIAAALFVAAPLAVVSANAQGYSYEQERYCTGDAFRLCGAYIPDVDRITACMVQRKAELSPGCRAVFGPPRQVSAPIARAPATRERPSQPGLPSGSPGVLPPGSPPYGAPRPPVFDDYDD